MPHDKCRLDPDTKARIGPGVLSTVFFGLFALSVVSAITFLGSSIGKDGLSPTDRGMIGLSAASYALAIYGYWRYYRMCQPWMGWFILIIGGTIATMLLPRQIADTTSTPPSADPVDPLPAKAPRPEFGNATFSEPAVTSDQPTQPLGWQVDGPFVLRPRGETNRQCLFLTPDPTTGCGLTQNLSTLTPGTTYRVTPSLYDLDDARDGTALMHLQVDTKYVHRDVQTSGYTSVFVEFTATASSHQLRISFTAPKKRIKLELYGLLLIHKADFGAVLGWTKGGGPSEVVV